MLLDKQATVVTEMQDKHLEAMSGLQQKMLDSEEVHARRLQENEQARMDNEASHQMAMDDLRQQLLQQQQISMHQQKVQLSFASKADELTATLAAYMPLIASHGLRFALIGSDCRRLHMIAFDD